LADAWRLEYNHRRPHSSWATRPRRSLPPAVLLLPLRLRLRSSSSTAETSEVTVTRYPTNTLITPGTENGGRSPRLRKLPFETEIIERYRRKESSVEESLIQMYLAGVSVRRVEDITEACGASASVPAPSAS